MLRIRAAGAFLCLCCTLAPATTLAPLSTAQLIDRAELVCCVRCDRTEARRDARTGIVFTHVRLTLLEDLKGRSAGSTVELRIVGGRANGVETVVAGMPRFRAGAESIVMLGKRNRAGYPVVIQARRGVLHLTKDKAGTRYLANRVSGLEECKGKRRVELDDFRAAVRRLVREKREAAK